MLIDIQGNYVWIDAEDYEKVMKYNWYIAKHGYVRMTNRSKTYLHHLLIGKQEGFVVDHINQDKLDNRKRNLRHVTKGENNSNRQKKCVYYDKDEKRRKRWRVVINNKYIGRYHAEEEALQVVLKINQSNGGITHENI